MPNPIRLTPLAGLLLASACVPPVSTPPPSVDDVRGIVEAKPKPHAEAVFDAKVKAADDEAIESWGERLRAAGVNLCLVLEDRFKVDYPCSS